MSRQLTSGVLGSRRREEDEWLYKGEVWEYEEVTSPHTGRVWMDRNLGADRVAQSITDSLSFGDLFQWGRLDDLHQNRDSSTTTTQSIGDVPGHGDFIIENVAWQVESNSNLWQPETRLNLPAPDGWRLPSIAEMLAEINNFSQIETDFNNGFLKIPRNAFRDYADNIIKRFDRTYYWSHTFIGTNPRYLRNGVDSIGNPAWGFGVRLIKI